MKTGLTADGFERRTPDMQLNRDAEQVGLSIERALGHLQKFAARQAQAGVPATFAESELLRGLNVALALHKEWQTNR